MTCQQPSRVSTEFHQKIYQQPYCYTSVMKSTIVGIPNIQNVQKKVVAKFEQFQTRHMPSCKTTFWTRHVLRFLLGTWLQWKPCNSQTLFVILNIKLYFQNDWVFSLSRCKKMFTRTKKMIRSRLCMDIR